jgi:hypothetical protein
MKMLIDVTFDPATTTFEFSYDRNYKSSGSFVMCFSNIPVPMVWGVKYNLALHFRIRNARDMIWGFEEEWYDGPIWLLGFGKYALFVWNESY